MRALCGVLELNSVRDNSWKSVWKAWDPVVRPMMSQRTSYTRGWRTHDFHAESIIGYIRPNNVLLIMTVQMVCLGCMWRQASPDWGIFNAIKLTNKCNISSTRAPG